MAKFKSTEEVNSQGEFRVTFWCQGVQVSPWFGSRDEAVKYVRRVCRAAMNGPAIVR